MLISPGKSEMLIMFSTWMAYLHVIVKTQWAIHMLDVMLVCTWTAFSHISGNVSSKQATKQARIHISLLTSHMTQFAKPNIMVHTKIFSIKHNKILVQKMHFIKYLQWLYKGYNLDILTLIGKTYAPSCALSREEYKSLWVILIF